MNPEGTDRSCLIDVRITHPLVGRTNLNRPHQSMSNSYNEKNAKYAELSFDCGYDFLPFIVSSTGQIDERSLSWFERQVKGYLSKRGIGGIKELELEKRMNFWTKRFSCLIQRCLLARSMIEKSSRIFYEQNVIANREVLCLTET